MGQEKEIPFAVTKLENRIYPFITFKDEIPLSTKVILLGAKEWGEMEVPALLIEPQNPVIINLRSPGEEKFEVAMERTELSQRAQIRQDCWDEGRRKGIPASPSWTRQTYTDLMTTFDIARRGVRMIEQAMERARI